MKLIEVLNSRMSFSFEVFPPKTDAGMEKLREALTALLQLQARLHQLHVWSRWQQRRSQRGDLPAIKEDGVTEVLTHFTCIGNTREKIDSETRELPIPGRREHPGHAR